MPINENSRKNGGNRFGPLASGYVRSQTHAHGQDLDLLVEIARPRTSWLALDVATGGGHTALRLARHVRRVCAVDANAMMLQAARAHIAEQQVGNISLVCTSSEILPFGNTKFHLVTCRIAAHHFADVAAFVEEAARVLVPGGTLLIQDHLLPDDAQLAIFIEEFERLRDPSHIRAFTAGQWADLIGLAGLKLLQIQKVTKRHVLRDWARRQDCSRATTKRLLDLAANASPKANEWMQWRQVDTPDASFVNHHMILAAQRR
jgi:ubiquinone/menaquinone biosynthesis C-methylase UbiE